MLPIGIIGAMDSEVALLLNALQDAQKVSIGTVTYYSGRLGSVDVVIARCGIGKVCAAMCAQAMIDRFAVRGIVNTGVAGGVGDGLHIGDMVLSTFLVQHDFDVTAFGHTRGYMCDGGDHTKPTHYVADAHLRHIFHTAATALGTIRAVEGGIASGDVFVADAALKTTLAQDFGVLAAEMEGAAIAQVATANRVPFLVVRAISDLADNSASVSFNEFEKVAAVQSAQLLMTALANV